MSICREGVKYSENLSMSAGVATRKKKVFGCVRELRQTNKSDLSYLRPVDRRLFLKNLEIQLELLPQVLFPTGK